MAVPFLRGLHGAEWPIDLVVSRPDTRRRRNADPEPSPVKAAALDLGLPVSDDPADVATSGADLAIVVAYGRIIKPDLLAQVPMVNVHFSRLPRWRGAAPVERAILAGDETTGVDVMVVEEGLDTGPVYARHQTEIGDHETAGELAQRLVGIGVPLLLDTLKAGLRDPTPQVGEPTYADKIDPAELRIDWRRSTIEIHRLVRLERAWTTFRGRRLKVLAGHPLPGSLAARGDGPGPARGGRHRSGHVPAGHRATRGEGCHEGQGLGPGREDRAGRATGRRAMSEDQVTGLQAKVLTVSDGVIAGTREDKSGAALEELLTGAGFEVVERRAVADGTQNVGEAIVELAEGFSGLVVTTGGTGFGPRDQTPEGTKVVLDREAPGIAEAMRLVNPLGRLSRGVAGTRGLALVLNTPGSSRGAVETVEAVLDVIPHALRLMTGESTQH